MLQLLRNTCGNLKLIEDLCFRSKQPKCNTSVFLQKTLGTKYSLIRTLCTSPTKESNEYLSEIDIKALTQGDPDLEHKLKVIMLEVEVMKQEGKAVPSTSFIKSHQWQEILNLNTRTSRRKYLEYLFKLEKKKENIAAKKEQNRISFEQKKLEATDADDDEMSYKLGKNNIFLRVRDTTINQMYNNKLIQAIQFGQKLIVDCGYCYDMTSRENINCAKQLTLLFAENRFHNEPYDLHFCNTVPQNILMQALHRNIATLYEPWFPLHIHEKSYLDLFPKEQLVYLTPHCREELLEYDHDAIYIVGAIVDKVNQEPLSLAKAKKENLKMAKLPLDKYLQWGAGSGKSLTLNQVTSILLDLKQTGDWSYALRHVPKRKLTDFTVGSAIGKYTSLSYDKNNYARKTWKPNRQDLNSERNLERNSKQKLLNVQKILRE